MKARVGIVSGVLGKEETANVHGIHWYGVNVLCL